MDVNGEYKFKAPIDKVWKVLTSPAALKASLPGCEKLDEVEPNTYDITMKVGVASIKGSYSGRITMDDVEAPKHYKLIVAGQGGAGFLKGEGTFDLTEQEDGTSKETIVLYNGSANVGGTLAGIGARMLGPVAKKLAGDFFKNMDKQIQVADAQAESEGQPS